MLDLAVRNTTIYDGSGMPPYRGEVGVKAGAAWLEGQPMAYLRAQLETFASGARHNDIDEQMRNVAREMTPREIDAASRYYAEHP